MDALRGAASLDWSESKTVSSWEGIALNASSTRVTELELDDEDLDGAIPAALGRLSALETLDLSDNDLTGEIPAELSGLWSLQTLRLSGNSLTGCIPPALKSVATNDLSSLNLPYCPPPGSTPTPTPTPTATPTPTPTATPTPTPTPEPSPDAPAITGVVPGTSSGQLVVSWEWDGDSCFITGASSGYEVNYKKATVASWRDGFLVTADTPNDSDSGAYEIFADYGRSAITETFTIGASASGIESYGQVGAALDAVAYDVRVIVFSGVCSDKWSPYSEARRGTPTR